MQLLWLYRMLSTTQSNLAHYGLGWTKSNSFLPLVILTYGMRCPDATWDKFDGMTERITMQMLEKLGDPKDAKEKER